MPPGRLERAERETAAQSRARRDAERAEADLRRTWPEVRAYKHDPTHEAPPTAGELFSLLMFDGGDLPDEPPPELAALARRGIRAYGRERGKGFLITVEGLRALLGCDEPAARFEPAPPPEPAVVEAAPEAEQREPAQNPDPAKEIEARILRMRADGRWPDT